MPESNPLEVLAAILAGIGKGTVNALEAQQKMQQLAAELELRKEALGQRSEEMGLQRTTAASTARHQSALEGFAGRKIALEEQEAGPLDASDPLLEAMMEARGGVTTPASGTFDPQTGRRMTAPFVSRKESAGLWKNLIAAKGEPGEEALRRAKAQSLDAQANVSREKAKTIGKVKHDPVKDEQDALKLTNALLGPPKEFEPNEKKVLRQQTLLKYQQFVKESRSPDDLPVDENFDDLITHLSQYQGKELDEKINILKKRPDMSAATIKRIILALMLKNSKPLDVQKPSLPPAPSFQGGVSPIHSSVH